MALAIRLGDSSTHGGTVTSVSTVNTKIEGALMARVGDLHTCPIPGHGITQIVNGAGPVMCEGGIVAVEGSVCGCGAVLIPSSLKSNLPGVSAPLGVGTLDGQAVLGAPVLPNLPFIVG